MTEQEARGLYAKLAAAFPAARREDATTLIYVEALKPLTNTRRALEAVNMAIKEHRDSRSLPAVAQVLDRYWEMRDAFNPPALPEPDVSPEQHAENARQAQAMVDRILARSRIMENA